MLWILSEENLTCAKSFPHFFSGCFNPSTKFLGYTELRLGSSVLLSSHLLHHQEHLGTALNVARISICLDNFIMVTIN